MAKAKLVRCGHSFVFTVPRAIAEQLSAPEGTIFDMVLDVPEKSINFKKVS